MDVIVTAESPDLNARVDTRFGRCAHFVRVNTDTFEAQALDNPGASASGGAGTQAAQFVANQQVEAAVSGDFGPNALRLLKAAGITMYLLGASETVRDAVERLNNGVLEEV